MQHPALPCTTPNTTGQKIASPDSTEQAHTKMANDLALYNLLQGPGSDAVLESETREANRNYVYRVLKEDYTTTHAGLIAFYTEQQDSTIADYTDIDSLIAEGDFIAAQNRNSGIAANSLMQQNQQMVNAMLLKSPGSLTQTELSDLEALANKCPLVDGNAVYQARALLCALSKDNLQFDENCDFENSSKTRKRTVETGTGAEPQSISLFPNPSKGNMTLRYKINRNALIVVCDLSGRVVYKQVLDKDAGSIDLQTQLAEGMYLYSITDDAGRLLKTDKIVVIE